MSLISRLSGPLVFIGDVHGQLGELERLWQNVQGVLGEVLFDKLNVIFLGDYCDRGSDTQGVVDFILSSKDRRPNQTHIYLCGNHDFALQAFLRIGSPFACTDFAVTQKGFKPRSASEPIYTGEGWEKMHIQGRRWGGFNALDDWNVFDSAPTFRSYGAKVGDRQGLLERMPKHHQHFFSNLQWMAEIQSNVGNVVAVHAGFEETNIATQIQRLKEKWAWAPFIEPLAGRGNVLKMPSYFKEPVLQDPGSQPIPQFLVSGHHGFVQLNGRRLVIDGSTEGKVTAVLLNAQAVPPKASARAGASTRRFGALHMEVIESSA